MLDLKRDGTGAEGDVQEQLIELRKLRQQISDERVDYQRTVREQARQDSFVELVRRAMKAEVKPFVDRYDAPVIDSDSDMVVMLSDLHAGIEIDNVWNRYNTAIMQERLEKYLCEVRKIQAEHKCKVCEFVLLGDLISGLIHRNLRLENNENVIEQVKIVSVCIGEFVKRLSEMFETVRVHAVSGNHSRITPSKDEHLKGEELDDLVEFYLSLMFENVSNVKFGDEQYGRIDSTINLFETRFGKRFVAVHGDKDTPSAVLERMTLMTGKRPAAVLMAHRHHNAFDSGTMIVQNGSVVGVDNHAIDLRIVGRPEQALFITDENEAVRCLYNIRLD